MTLALLLGACSHSEGGSAPSPPAAGLPSPDAVAAVPMGHIAGVTDSAALARSIPNPYADNPQAIAAGSALYIKMNCAGCHAYTGKGNMGPNLTDTYWRYGGLPVQIYRSIHDGRAQGMPAWGAALPPAEIWKLVAYIQSLGGTYPVDGAAPNPQLAERVAPELLLAQPSRATPPSGSNAVPDKAPAGRPAPAGSAPSTHTSASPPVASPAGASSS